MKMNRCKISKSTGQKQRQAPTVNNPVGLETQQHGATLEDLVSEGESSATNSSGEDSDTESAVDNEISSEEKEQGKQLFQSSIADDGDDRTSTKFSNAVDSLFASPRRDRREKRAASVVSVSERSLCKESALFGYVKQRDEELSQQPIYLNVHTPFCLCVCGVQGAGKSHTLSVVLESCLIPFKVNQLVTLAHPMAALMFHYDQSETNVCEVTGIIKLNTRLSKYLSPPQHAKSPPHWVPQLPKVVVLVSPTFYKQRRRFYGLDANSSVNDGNFDVQPLLFSWKSLDAVQLRSLLHVKDKDNQLYVSVLLNLLRGYQRDEHKPTFDSFCKQVLEACSSNKGQSGPLEQRLNLLKQVVAESEVNKDIRCQQKDLRDLARSGTLVIADLTDPMLSPHDADGIFQVLLQQFRQLDTRCGKVVVCDEAHKYFHQEGLSTSIVETVRLMRHEGIRVIVSTQSPNTMPPELLELSTITVLHRFHSQGWWKYLSSKIPLPLDGFKKVRSLNPGEAVVFAQGAKLNLGEQSVDCVPECWEEWNDNEHKEGTSSEDINNEDVFVMSVRERITRDRGRSRLNKKKKIVDDEEIKFNNTAIDTSNVDNINVLASPAADATLMVLSNSIPSIRTIAAQKVRRLILKNGNKKTLVSSIGTIAKDARKLFSKKIIDWINDSPECRDLGIMWNEQLGNNGVSKTGCQYLTLAEFAVKHQPKQAEFDTAQTNDELREQMFGVDTNDASVLVNTDMVEAEPEEEKKKKKKK